MGDKLFDQLGLFFLAQGAERTTRLSKVTHLMQKHRGKEGHLTQLIPCRFWREPWLQCAREWMLSTV